MIQSGHYFLFQLVFRSRNAFSINFSVEKYEDKNVFCIPKIKKIMNLTFVKVFDKTSKIKNLSIILFSSSRFYLMQKTSLL